MKVVEGVEPEGREPEEDVPWRDEPEGDKPEGDGPREPRDKGWEGVGRSGGRVEGNRLPS